MTPTPIATPARPIKGILEAKYLNPSKTIVMKERFDWDEQKKLNKGTIHLTLTQPQTSNFIKVIAIDPVKVISRENLEKPLNLNQTKRMNIK